MNSVNAFEINPERSVVECASNLTDEDFTRKTKVDETVSQTVSDEITTNNPKKSGGKKFEQPAKAGKMSLRRKNPIKELSEKINKSVPISQMVMESIKALRKRNGASREAILEHMEGQFKVNAKLVKNHVSIFLASAVQRDIVEQITGAGDVPKYKIKKAEKITTKTVKKSNANQKMVKAEKIAKISQKLNNQKTIKAKKTAKAEQKSKPEDGRKGVKVPKVK